MGECVHQPYACAAVTRPERYAITRGVKQFGETRPELIRWSDDDDPPFPCLCKCEECEEWRALYPPEPLPEE